MPNIEHMTQGPRRVEITAAMREAEKRLPDKPLLDQMRLACRLAGCTPSQLCKAITA